MPRSVYHAHSLLYIAVVVCVAFFFPRFPVGGTEGQVCSSEYAWCSRYPVRSPDVGSAGVAQRRVVGHGGVRGLLLGVVGHPGLGC